MFYFFLRLTLGVFLRVFFNIKFENRRLFKTLKPPFLVLPNHVNLYDPFLVNCGVPWPIYWVAADANFRDPFLGKILRLIGTIPKTKNMSDLETVKIIHRYARNGEVVGVFGEGQQTWTGRTLPMIVATAKLAQFLKIPVVTVVTKGGFLARPRWSYTTNRSRITITYTLLLTPEQLKTIPLEDLERKLADALDYDEYAHQRQVLYPVNGNRRAECLEILGFTCPSCKGISTIRSYRNEAHCRVCGFSLQMDGFGFPRFPADAPSGIESFYDWDQWQRAYWRDNLPTDTDSVLFEDRDIDLFISVDRKPLERVGRGTIILYPERMEIHNAIGDSFVFSLKSLQGLNVFKQRYLEFHYDRIAYHVRFRDRHASPYKWMVFYELLLSRQT